MTIKGLEFALFFRIGTLGCKVNQYESEYLREGLLRLGYIEAGSNRFADLVLVNTCTVTAESDLKSRKLVRKMLKKNPGAEAVVFGCSAARDPESFREIPGVREVVTDKSLIPQFLNARGLIDIPQGIERFGNRHRAYVKVQDGCCVGCSYCIIPKVRPILRSRPMAEVLDEIRRLSHNGYREIILTGIHLGHYGLDLAGTPMLDQLVRGIIELPEPFRLRISSLEAVEVSDELVHLMVRNSDRLCPHLHLSMQSGSNEVLKRMRRRWLYEPFVKRCEEIVAQFDRLALTTDVIVGFPGETEAHFEETCLAVQRLRFSKVHIFRFSPRAGTEAATLPDQISPDVQRQRAERLESLSKTLRNDYASSLRDMVLSILLESELGGTADRYVDVRFHSKVARELIGLVVQSKITSVCGDQLFADG